jgi:hypothetical protein
MANKSIVTARSDIVKRRPRAESKRMIKEAIERGVESVDEWGGYRLLFESS